MNMQKFTEKSLEAIQNAGKTAREYGNPEINGIHLLYALLIADGGLIPDLLNRAGVDVKNVTGNNIFPVSLRKRLILPSKKRKRWGTNTCPSSICFSR